MRWARYVDEISSDSSASKRDSLSSSEVVEFGILSYFCQAKIPQLLYVADIVVK